MEVCVLRINYYNRFHCNAVKVFSNLRDNVGD
jgi:hypothetical protein